MNSQRRVAMHVAPRTVNRSFLLGLAGGNSPEGRVDEREYEDGRDHLAHAASVAETTPGHTQHTAHNSGLLSRFASPCGGFPKMFHVYREITIDLTC